MTHRFIIGFLIVLLGISIAIPSFSQPNNLDQLKAKQRQLEQKKNHQKDTALINTLNQIAIIYADTNPDTALAMLSKQVQFCKDAGYRQGEADAYKITGNAYLTKGNYDLALQYFEKCFKLADKIGYKKMLPGILGNLGLVYLNQGNYPEALKKFYESLRVAESMGDKSVIGTSFNNIANVHFYQGKMDEAEKGYQKTLDIALELADTSWMILAYNNIGEVNLEQQDPAKARQNLTLAHNLLLRMNIPNMMAAVSNTLGDTYLRLDSLQKSIEQFENALRIAKEKGYARANVKALIGLAKVYTRLGQFTNALQNGLEGVRKAEDMKQAQLKRDANEIVAQIYESIGDGNNAIKYYKKYKIYSDSLVNLESERAAANYKANYEFSKKEQEFERKTLQQRWLIFSAFAALFSLLVILWIINRNKKRLNQTYKDLQSKNIIIEGQKLKAEETLSKLKATQDQLVQSEKMASLGELTAGIAHEIQNPLNFVNNFSEVSKELLEEMKTALDDDNTDEAKVIAGDVIQNLEKINHHGKRADAIVKGMLQHSRSSGVVKEPTDINKLADEYLRLSYHGLRAKDMSFNATMKTEFDEQLNGKDDGTGLIDVITQDMGRVILNLLTNAFYSVTEKSATEKDSGNTDYEPTVSISTKKFDDHIEIKVSDNGNGIPKEMMDKIFQPFFTTKPTGRGTGLGLSMSYDIVTKGHGGTLKVESSAGTGSQFFIILPI